MAHRVFLVHDDLSFLRECQTALCNAGYDVEAFDNSMTALHRLERSESVDVLVTRARFPSGQPNGVALANMAKRFHPGIKNVVTAVPEVAHFADDLGIVLVAPVKAIDVVNAVSQAVTGQQ